MATPTVQDFNAENDSIIAGYFTNGDDAHRAINALLDEGFLPNQIGAAFHTSGAASGGNAGSAQGEGADVREELGTTLSTGTSDSELSQGGPSSDTTAVQPVGLATGTGSPILGAGKPGRISGSSLENTGLPSELQHELSHDAPGSGQAYQASAASVSTTPVHESTAASSKSTSWTSKLKHLFDSHSKDEKKGTGVSADEETSQKFGTGEGYLNLEPSRAYSQPDFESTAAKAGVPADHSRHLSHRLGQGGAVVTVSVTGRAIEVEKIFERHHGEVRLEDGVIDTAVAPPSEQRIELFGHLEHHYPGSRG